ncbi:hypothetical protein [Actinoallomurus iriomotensis]|uniref:5-bromo-4-chloroindolyl phosphate hydrolysis protein n=1 Tax=Actinoallomurus iriomotensis TaxID=478107 RepID=A0A9W6S7X7_9ACTN|nr:hypothetical protein [Actinoallomurus iriomotensis]GLY88738.1 hypothetical protein Airi02_066670 [Actinoallomurus iriomotensis]
MATSRWWRYLGSAKNLAGCLGGLAGLGLYFAGTAGPYWPVVVAGLYGAGALIAPPEKVRLVIDDTVAETSRLRTDLDGLVTRVPAHRLPAPAVERFEETTAMLRDVLERADLLSLSPDALYEVSRAIRTDLPTSLESYLNLPRWYGARHGGDAAKELTTQLNLIADSVSRTAGEVYASEERRMRDHTRYLRDRDAEPPPV